MLLEDYALIGDLETAALVARNGSIDWLCLPRFDSPACFASLLGMPAHGRWLIAPRESTEHVSRQYRRHSLVLETEFVTSTGCVRVVDCMPPRQREPSVIRVIEGVRGDVAMEMELIIRFDYGSIVPWVRTIEDRLLAIGGPDAVSLWTPVKTFGVDLTTRASFTVHPGEHVAFLLMWHPSHQSPQRPSDALRAVEETTRWWERWCAGCSYQGEWREDILRSLIVLKALTYDPSGGVVAAPTTSLPEQLGGVRNWDYRYCWLRDATYTLFALILSGFTEEAAAWRNWLLRAAAGDAAKLQILYGPAGERRLTEQEIGWLPGYEGARPVRVGNAAVDQRQLDVYGEILDAMYLARRAGMKPDPSGWALEVALVDFVEKAWSEPDDGIWEVRGPRRHFTHSKVMAWVAVDRAIKISQQYHLSGPVERWRRLRGIIHADVCRQGFDASRNAFTQFYGSREVDASLLMLPLVGFLPADDPRILGTISAIEHDLIEHGFVRRYRMTEHSADVDGLTPGEGMFLPCTLWLADNYALLGRREEARRTFERVLAVRNDLGLLSEEFDWKADRMVGNFPQAFSHVGVVITALNLTHPRGPAETRRS
jgi:GH15 family glucan-1,4-alpha-glucosidase